MQDYLQNPPENSEIATWDYITNAVIACMCLWGDIFPDSTQKVKNVC